MADKDIKKDLAGKEKRKTILIADDMPSGRAVIAEIFLKEYEILEAADGTEAIELLNKNSGALAAVILDVLMPKKSGFEVMEYMRDKGFLSSIPVVFITAMEKPENELRIWNLGASDVISKPFLPHIVKKRVENIINLYQDKRKMSEMLEYQQQKQDFFHSELVDVLSSLIEYRSLESRKHITRIRIYTKILLTKLATIAPDYYMDKDTILTISEATALHDIGKIVVPDMVLNKPDKLTKEEFEVIKQHPIVGSRILSRLLGGDMTEYMRYAYDICRYHHERWDGGGYPDGLEGNEIPIWAQVASLADVYDALTTDRVYKTAHDHNTSVSMILSGECGSFSPLLLDCLKAVEKEFDRASKKYRDKTEGEEQRYLPKNTAAAVNQSSLSALHKYFAMLQLLGDIVYEFNSDSGEYHLAYPLSADYGFKESGNFFSDIIGFINNSVHLSERDAMLEGISVWQSRIKGGLLTPAPLECRIFTRDTYHWFRLSFKPVISESGSGGTDALIRFQDLGGENELENKIKDAKARKALLTTREREALSEDYARTLELLDYFGDCFAEYDLKNNIATYYYDGHRSVLPFTAGKDYLIAFVHPDDVMEYREHLKRLLSGNEVEDLQFRMGSGGRYSRRLKRSVILRGTSGEAIRIISSIVDADRLLWHINDIKIKSQIDQMTGSLNKTMTEYSVSKILSASDEKTDRHTMLLIDLDDFKLINDTFGHLTGDGVIKSVSSRLRAENMAGDIVGRIGGDEFIVLIKGVAAKDSVEKRIRQIFIALSELTLKNSVDISISMGVARYPFDGTDYLTLFENADKALYQAKNSGKGRYCFADKAGGIVPTPKLTRIESDALNKRFNDIISHILLDTDNPKQAIESVFDFTARTLSLISITAVDKSDKVLYEWQADTCYKPFCRLGTAAQRLDFSSGAGEISGVHICSDAELLDPQIAAIFKDEDVGSFISVETGDSYAGQGYIVFAAKERGRQWRQDEILAVRTIGKMYSLLHAKEFADAQSRQAQLLIDTVFDTQTKCCYVVDETFHVLRANQKAKEIDKKCEGEYCYNVLCGRASPCENCPVLKLNTQKTKAASVVHSRKLEKDIHVFAESHGEEGKKLIILSFDLK